MGKMKDLYIEKMNEQAKKEHECIYCGAYIPEGRHVCPHCERNIVKSIYSCKENDNYIALLLLDEENSNEIDELRFGMIGIDREIVIGLKDLNNALQTKGYIITKVIN